MHLAQIAPPAYNGLRRTRTPAMARRQILTATTPSVVELPSHWRVLWRTDGGDSIADTASKLEHHSSRSYTGTGAFEVGDVAGCGQRESGAIVAWPSPASSSFRGFTFGIDFKGGTTVTPAWQHPSRRSNAYYRPLGRAQSECRGR